VVVPARQVKPGRDRNGWSLLQIEPGWTFTENPGDARRSQRNVKWMLPGGGITCRPVPLDVANAERLPLGHSMDYG